MKTDRGAHLLQCVLRVAADHQRQGKVTVQVGIGRRDRQSLPIDRLSCLRLACQVESRAVCTQQSRVRRAGRKPAIAPMRPYLEKGGYSPAIVNRMQEAWCK